MGIPFDYSQERPDNIETILNGLDRYNPETTGVFEAYVESQCADKSYDAYANIALLKLYQFNPHLTNHEITTNVLVKALTVFPQPDFALCLSLLPPYSLLPKSTTKGKAPRPDAAFCEQVQKLNTLSNLLVAGKYPEFWSTYDGDDDMADMVADITGFEELIRLRIVVAVSQTWREMQKDVLEEWLNLGGSEFGHLMSVVGFKIEGDLVKIPLNKENEAKGTVIREVVKVDQFSRLIRRAYEQPA